MAKKASRSPARTNPHVATKEAECQHQHKPMIYLLVDPEGARLIADGILPAYVQEQAERSLDWFAVDARKD